MDGVRGLLRRWRKKLARLHRDGVLGVAGDVPARADAAMGEEGADTGDVFFGLLRVNLVINFVVFEWNGEKAITVDAADAGAQSGIVHAKLQPKKVAEIDEQEHDKHGE